MISIEVLDLQNVQVSVDEFGLVELTSADGEALLTASQKVQDELGLVEMCNATDTVVLGEKDKVLDLMLGAC